MEYLLYAEENGAAAVIDYQSNVVKVAYPDGRIVQVCSCEDALAIYGKAIINKADPVLEAYNDGWAVIATDNPSEVEIANAEGEIFIVHVPTAVMEFDFPQLEQYAYPDGLDEVEDWLSAQGD